MPAGTLSLVTVEEAEGHLGLSPGSEEASLSRLCDAVSAAIERHCAKAFVKRDIQNESHPQPGLKRRSLPYLHHLQYDRLSIGDLTSLPGSAQIPLRLKFAPVNSLASVADLAGNALIEETHYWVVQDRGLIQGAGRWPNPEGEHWLVTYNAGLFDDTAGVDADLKEAALRWLALIRSQNSPDRTTLKSLKAGSLELQFVQRVATSRPPDELLPLLRRHERGSDLKVPA